MYTIELYKQDGKYCAYIGEECGSGYEISEDTKSECARKIAEHIEDNGEWEEE